MSVTGYKKNHTLTASLLRRFADSEGKILLHSVSGEVTPRTVPVNSQGFYKGLWQRASAKLMEEFWGKHAEADMNKVFRKLDSGNHLTLNDKKLLVRFMTVHYVRSKELIKLYKRELEAKAQLLTFDDDLSRPMRYAARLQFLEESGIPSSLFEKFVRDQYQKCLRYLKGFGLEISIATGTSTFVLPDGGLLLRDSDTGRSQPTGGVSLLQATNVVMPLGPRHLAAFTTKARKVMYRSLSDTEVARGNENLRLAAVEVFYSHP